MEELTNEMILSDLNVISSDNNVGIFVYILCLIAVTILLIKSKKKIPIYKIIIMYVVISIPFYIASLKTNAIKYSLKHDSWSVKVDYIEKIEKEKTNILFTRNYTHYYAYLEKYGKVDIPKEGYDNLPENQEVYIITVKGRFGNTYVTRLIYPTNEFNYTE